MTQGKKNPFEQNDVGKRNTKKRPHDQMSSFSSFWICVLLLVMAFFIALVFIRVSMFDARLSQLEQFAGQVVTFSDLAKNETSTKIPP